MSIESASERRRKHIVEHYISGFNTAEQAVIFGNTLEMAVAEKDKKYKFKQYVGAGIVAVTPEYTGETTLKTEFLEVYLGLAQFIIEHTERMVTAHNEIHGADLKSTRVLIREKPQAQSVDADHLKADISMGRIGG